MRSASRLELFHPRTGARHELDTSPAEHALVQALFVGVDELPAVELVERLRALGLLARQDQLADRTRKELLAQIEEPYSWCIESARSERPELYERLLEAHSYKRLVFDSYQQCPVLPETALRRALLAGDHARQIVLVGDDDLLCIPLAMMGHDVMVLDIDAHLARVIGRLSERWQLSIEVRVRDLTQPLDADLEGRFDLFYVDPFPAPKFIELFMARSMACLKDGGRGFVAMPEQRVSLVDELARRYRWPLVRLLKHFNHYYYPVAYRLASSRSTSDCLELERVPRSEIPRETAAADELFDDIGGMNDAWDLRCSDPAKLTADGLRGYVEALRRAGVLGGELQILAFELAGVGPAVIAADGVRYVMASVETSRALVLVDHYPVCQHTFRPFTRATFAYFEPEAGAEQYRYRGLNR